MIWPRRSRSIHSPRIVFQLLSDRNVNELIKSKSMLTEECDTRRFLEERGIRVSETDLGERIQQLDDQPPSHIVGPAWHKTTQDIADVFAKAYGSDKERADPVYLAHVMRENTRPLIVRARAGMTGANFAVAETGAIVTVTNEGNADLSGNVPELRICSVGLEKIIPRNEDLAIFIRLLTRSATGIPSPSTRRTFELHGKTAKCTSSWSITAALPAWAWRSSGHHSSASGVLPA